MVAKGARLSYIIYLISSIFKCKFFQSTQSLGVKWQAHMLHRSLPKYPFNFFNTCFAVTFVSPTYQTKVTRCLFYMLQNTFFLLTVPSTSNSLRWLYVPSSLGVFPSLHPLVCTPALGGSQKAEPTVRETRCLRAQGHKSREESSFILSLLATSCCQYAEGSENSLYCWWSISDSHWDRPYRSKFHSFGSWRQHQDNYLASLIYVTKANQALSLGVFSFWCSWRIIDHHLRYGRGLTYNNSDQEKRRALRASSSHLLLTNLLILTVHWSSKFNIGCINILGIHEKAGSKRTVARQNEIH